jgi:uncharacterized protein (DUF1501 family)
LSGGRLEISHGEVIMARLTYSGLASRLSRREWLKLSTAGVVGYSMSGWLGSLAADLAKNPLRKRSCILLWMGGGPSQLDTFDLKPGHPNGGPFSPINTSVPGIQVSEHFSRIANLADHLAIIRSMTSKEGDHNRATFLLRTGYVPDVAVQYPPLGALVSKELGDDTAELPNFVSIAPLRVTSPNAYGAGFLGPGHAPLIVGENIPGRGSDPQTDVDSTLKVRNLAPPPRIGKGQADARVDILEQVERDFLIEHADASVRSHQNAYQRAVRLMRSAAAAAFELDAEKSSVRDAYGRNLFGQGCLLARRLVEHRVPFVEVSLDGWDTHNDNARTVRSLSETVDVAWSALMTDLKERGLLETTTIVWMGEFGRTPQFGRPDGRDHWPNSFSAVLVGGGIRGGQVIGDTGPDGASIKQRPVTVPEFLATICGALGIDYQKQNDSNAGRPIGVVAAGTRAVSEALS